MPNVFRAALIAAAALALAGCYVTTKPLITQANAAYPFTAGAYKSYEWREDKTWKLSGSGAISRVGDHYRLHHNPDPGEAPDSGDDIDFIVADLGDGYYAAEVQDKDDPNIMLDVVKVEGDAVYQYVLSCEPEDKTLADRGIIDKFEASQYSPTCTVSSLDQLRRAFRAKLAAGLVPHGKYVVTH
jgi:hypothetical protein